MTMNLKYAIEKFVKLAQSPDEQLVELGQDLMQFSAASMPGTSLNEAKIQELGRKFYSGLVLKQPQEMLSALRSLLSETSSGGGALYDRLRQAYNKVMQANAPKAPPPQLSSNYYKLLNELISLANKSKSTDHDTREYVKNKFQELKPSLDNLNEYLEFQSALAGTASHSNNPEEKRNAAFKLKEIEQFNNKLNMVEKQLKSMLFDYAGQQPQDVEGPNPLQSETVIS